MVRQPGARPHISSPKEFVQAFEVSRETVAGLEQYASLLRQWQKAVNLVAPSTLDDVWHRHFADSAQLYALAPATASRWLDLGSGAGFPGVVIAVLLKERGHPGDRVVLVESDTRKAAFLREVVRRLALPVDILGTRIEKSATHAKLATVDVVTARALAPLDRLLGLCSPFFGAATVGLFLKGRDVDAEIAEARKTWAFAVSLKESLTDREGRIAVIRQVQRLDGGGPRP